MEIAKHCSCMVLFGMICMPVAANAYSFIQRMHNESIGYEPYADKKAYHSIDLEKVKEPVLRGAGYGGAGGPVCSGGVCHGGIVPDGNGTQVAIDSIETKAGESVGTGPGPVAEAPEDPKEEGGAGDEKTEASVAPAVSEEAKTPEPIVNTALDGKEAPDGMGAVILSENINGPVTFDEEAFRGSLFWYTELFDAAGNFVEPEKDEHGFYKDMLFHFEPSKDPCVDGEDGKLNLYKLYRAFYEDMVKTDYSVQCYLQYFQKPLFFSKGSKNLKEIPLPKMKQINITPLSGHTCYTMAAALYLRMVKICSYDFTDEFKQTEEFKRWKGE